MIKTVICYKTRVPEVYNKGTKWERTHSDFLLYYTNKTREEAQQDVNRLNTTKPKTFCNGEKIDWDKIDYFYVDEQEEMSD